MTSMYERIMELPLFKGVSKDQVSLFLEKTHVDFKNYGAGEILADVGEPVKMVRFVISGDILLVHPLEGIDVTVEERSGFGKVLGADRLFGIATGYPYRAIAKTRTSIMEFSKAQYVNLLHSDSIYMLNFFNYLSLRAQRPVDSLMEYCHGDVMNRISQLICVMTEPAAERVIIRGSRESLADFCNCDVKDIDDWKNMLIRRNLAMCDAETVNIHSRGEFLHLAREVKE